MNTDGIPDNVHLVGAAGIHMSAIGQILLARGHQVTGSDLVTSEHTHRLEALGATIHRGHAAANLAGAELVVTTTAVAPDNPELAAARERGIPVTTRAEMVQRLIVDRDVFAVAGTHGKTTTTSLLALATVRAGLDPLVLLGGDARDLDDANARDGKGRVAVIEADEYKGAFLQYEPHLAIVTNIESDHLDYFESEEAIRDAFLGFARRVRHGGSLLVCADSQAAALVADQRQAEGARVERYGIDRQGLDWLAADIGANNRGGSDFTVLRTGAEVGRVSLAVPGHHNVLNATAALAAAVHAGADFGVAAQAAADFHGARRRFEVIAEVPTPDGVITVVDDYAHHPTEVRATLSAARQRFPGSRLVGCFQPHTYTRTQYLLDEFRTCFEALDALYLVPTFAARETPERGLDAHALVEAVERPPVVYVDSLDEAVDRIAGELHGGDAFFTLGAGDITEVAPRVAGLLARRYGPAVAGPSA